MIMITWTTTVILGNNFGDSDSQLSAIEPKQDNP